MSRKRNSIFALLICSVLVFSVTGCGKKKASTTTTTTAAAVTTDTTATDTTATETTDTTATDTTATETTDTTATDTTATTDLSGLASVGNCAELAGLATGLSEAFSGTGTQDLKKTAAVLKDFADKTPEDIRPDFEVLADTYAKIADALSGVDLSSGQTPSPEVLAKLTQLSSSIDTAALTKAETNISAWAAKNCTTP